MSKISNYLKDFPIKRGFDIFFLFGCFSTAQNGKVMTNGDEAPAPVLMERPRMA